MNKRQRKKQAKRAYARFAERMCDSRNVQRVSEVVISFVRAKLRQPSVKGFLFPSPAIHKPAGHWEDGHGMVHGVNALSLPGRDYSDAHVDLGRETACEALFWDPDEPWLYPNSTEDEVNCMACVVARSCSGD